MNASAGLVRRSNRLATRSGGVDIKPLAEANRPKPARAKTTSQSSDAKENVASRSSTSKKSLIGPTRDLEQRLWGRGFKRVAGGCWRVTGAVFH